MKGLLAAIGGLILFAVVLIIGTAVGAVAWYTGTYSGLNNGEQQVQRSWADIGSTMKRRADLIPNLVEVVKGSAAHEHDTLADVTEARAKIGKINIDAASNNPEVMQNLSKAQGEFSSALSRLMVVVEKYPDLKANENFRDLQSQVEGTENRINVAREKYNKFVAEQNARVDGLLSSYIAGRYNYAKHPFFEVTEAEKVTPKISFSKKDGDK